MTYFLRKGSNTLAIKTIPQLSFANRVVIVTGAGRGIGRAHALELAKRGAKVVVNDPGFSKEGEPEGSSPADAVVAEITKSNGAAIADHGEVASMNDVAALVDQALSRWGRIDAVVNNAGNVRRSAFTETDAEDLLSQVRTHVLGSLQLCRTVWPHMLAAGYGRIVLTTSQVGMYGQPNLAAYGAAKGGVIGLLQGMKIAALDTGIRVNGIAPFAVTRAAPPAFPSSLKGWMGGEQVSAAVVYLAHHSCTSHGEVFIAGGGHFAVARMVESRGIEFDRPEDVTAEGFVARIGEITDMNDWLTPTNALAAAEPTFVHLRSLFT